MYANIKPSKHRVADPPCTRHPTYMYLVHRSQTSGIWQDFHTRECTGEGEAGDTKGFVVVNVVSRIENSAVDPQQRHNGRSEHCVVVVRKPRDSFCQQSSGQPFVSFGDEVGILLHVLRTL